jgi:hypothetical protein
VKLLKNQYPNAWYQVDISKGEWMTVGPKGKIAFEK